MSLFMLLGVMFFLGLALLCFFNKDLMWEWHVQAARRKGLRESMLERTPEWENKLTWQGVGMFIFGLLCLFVLLVGDKKP